MGSGDAAARLLSHHAFHRSAPEAESGVGERQQPRTAGAGHDPRAGGAAARAASAGNRPATSDRMRKMRKARHMRAWFMGAAAFGTRRIETSLLL